MDLCCTLSDIKFSLVFFCIFLLFVKFTYEGSWIGPIEDDPRGWEYDLVANLWNCTNVGDSCGTCLFRYQTHCLQHTRAHLRALFVSPTLCTGNVAYPGIVILWRLPDCPVFAWTRLFCVTCVLWCLFFVHPGISYDEDTDCAGTWTLEAVDSPIPNHGASLRPRPGIWHLFVSIEAFYLFSNLGAVHSPSQNLCLDCEYPRSFCSTQRACSRRYTLHEFLRSYQRAMA